MFNVALVANPNDLQAHIFLGMISSQQGEHNTALIHYKVASNLSGNPKIIAQVASSLIALKRDKEALPYLYAALDSGSYPNPSELLVTLTRIYLDTDNTEEASKCLMKLIQQQPANTECYHQLAAVYLEQGLYDEVDDLFRTALNNGVDQLKLESIRLQAFLHQGKIESAIDLARHLHELYPSDFDNSFSLCVLYSKMSMFESTCLVLDGMKPDDDNQIHKLLLLRGTLALEQYDLDTAANYYDALHLADPQSVEGIDCLIRIRLMQGNIGAARALEKSLQNLHEFSSSQHVCTKVKTRLHAAILKEFSSNSFAAAKLTDTVSLPLVERLEAIARLIEDEPYYMASNLALLTCLKKYGAWDRETPESLLLPQGQKAIPRVVVQFWDNPDIPQDVASIMSSWQTKCTGFQHHVFNDQTAEDFIRLNCDQQVLKAFKLSTHAAMRADIFRLAYLLECGGIYVDADDMCRHDLSPILESGFSLVLLQEDLGTIGNNFIAAAPGHPWIQFTLEHIVKWVLNKQGDYIWFLTGPGAISNSFCRYYISHLREGRLPAGIRVRDSYQFTRFISQHLPRSYKRDSRHWSATENTNRSLFCRLVNVVHHYHTEVPENVVARNMHTQM